MAFKPQSAATQSANPKARAARHAKRMAAQMSRNKAHINHQPKVARGTARALRRAPLRAAWLAKQAVE